jgi:folate-binding Fe-S cluster repair protein YgfZ
LDQTAVDFHKGCYLGQEVVSRLESVGQARRGLLRWTSPAQVPVGTNLSISAHDATERTAGTITSTSPAPVGGLFFGLALVRTDLAAPGATLSASQKSGPTLEVTLHSIP